MRKQAKANVTPVRQRSQYSCMSASMCMALRAHGLDCTEDEVNRVMGARAMQGASWENALACAQHYGFRATLVTPSTVRQLKEWTDQGDPVMIAWNPEGREWSHASLVFDVDDDLNVYVADPNIPDPEETVRVVPKGEFYKKWIERWPNYLVRRPACAIQREITEDGQQRFARFQPGKVQVQVVRDGVEIALPVTSDILLKDSRLALPLLNKHVQRVVTTLREAGFEDVRPVGWALEKDPPRFTEKILVKGAQRRGRELASLIQKFGYAQHKRASSPEAFEDYSQSVLDLETAFDDVVIAVNKLRSLGVDIPMEEYPFMEDVEAVASDVSRWRQSTESTQDEIAMMRMASRVANRHLQAGK